MAEGDLDVAIIPNEIIAQAFNDLTDGKITKSQYDAILNKQRAELSKTYPAYGIGGQGYIAPMLNVYNKDDKLNAKLYQQQEELKKQLAGKAVLEPTAEKGIYSASVYQETGELKGVDTGKGPINPFAPSQKTFYSETGKKLTPAEVAASKTGQDFAAAGWDIGFGPGMIAPGIKADTTEREARIARQEAAQSAIQAPQPTRQVDPTPATPSTISSQPSNISPVTQAPPPPPVKTAPIDTILFNEENVPIEIMSDILFENIGGQELINIARNDTVNGQQIIYQPIKNLTQIQQQYNPNNIVALQATSDKYFQNFAIKFDNKVPITGTGPAGAHVYIDPTNGDLVVEAINLQEDEQIEVEITTGGTIYEAEL